MKVFKYLLVLFFLCSLTSQADVAGEIKAKFFSKIKTLLKKRGSFDYNNDILNPKNILSKTLIIDRVELNNVKINEIRKRYDLEEKAIDQIRAAFFASQPNVYKDFEFSLNSANLNQILNFTTFTEYIGCCFRQDNMINYIILRLSINTQIYKKNVFDKKECLDINIAINKIAKIHFDIKEFIEKISNDCNKTQSCIVNYNIKNCKYEKVDYKQRPLNNNERLKANNLVRAYSGEMFNLMIEDVLKETITIPQNLEIQSVFTIGQVFKNATYGVQAEIADYGDIEIKGDGSNKSQFLFKKECQKLPAGP